MGESTIKLVAETPPNSTSVTLVKPEPVIVTVAPAPATVGENMEITGAGTNVNPPNVAVPPGVVIETLPEAPAPTTAEIKVGEITVKLVAGTPPKLTAVAPIKFVPLIRTVPPKATFVGVKLVIVGG